MLKCQQLMGTAWRNKTLSISMGYFCSRSELPVRLMKNKVMTIIYMINISYTTLAHGADLLYTE